MTSTELLARGGAQNGALRGCSDLRMVQPGDVFVAVAGTKADGHSFIPQALAQGAKFIVTQKPFTASDASVRVVPVQDAVEALGRLAQAMYGYPNSKLTNLAVTGTNGKTTVAYLVRSVMKHAGRKCGLLGTVEYDTGSEVTDSSLTTPDPLKIAELSRKMVDNGCEYAVMEASSHALEQKRLEGVSFTAAAFTNLTGDHLDYHRTEENYLEAKARLFEGLPVHGIAVLNQESDAARQIGEWIDRRILWYGIDCEGTDVEAKIHSMDAMGSVFSLIFNNIMEKVRTPLCGIHNIQNHLAAAGLCLAAGLDLTQVAQGLSALERVPGRLEAVRSTAADRAGIRVFVDYAHTDDALVNVLSTLRTLCPGRLIAVFGCGGDRDRTKRPRMAQAVERLADEVIVTSDNPRTEDPEAIIARFWLGLFVPDAPTLHVEADRRKAIREAIRLARRGDLILVAGKGHENYQIIGKVKRHFSDYEEILSAAEEIL